jgi:plasmid stabilization system protein ParE
VTEANWKPLLRAPGSTVTKVLRSHAFRHSRELSEVSIDSADDLRALADLVEAVDYANAPLSAVADQVAAAVRFVRAIADRLDGRTVVTPDAPRASADEAHPGLAGTAARERLVVAALHYLVERDDLVPDFRPGGYIDDVLAMTWVFGAAVNELAPYLEQDPDVGEIPKLDPV